MNSLQLESYFACDSRGLSEASYSPENNESFANDKKRIYESENNRSAKKKRNNEPSYIDVFRCEKPAHLVARRNARERKRVQAVNSAFSRLQKAVPTENQSKRLSKVKTLQKAIEYISNLMNLLQKANDIEANSPCLDSPSDASSSSDETSFASFSEQALDKQSSSCHQLETTTTSELNAFIESEFSEQPSRDYYWNYFVNAIN